MKDFTNYYRNKKHMGNSWYKKSLPKLKIVKKSLEQIGKEILNIDNVKSVRLWGSLVKESNNPNFIVKDVDIIAVSDIFSEDLLSITDDEIHSPFNLSHSQLEDNGFNPKAVKFTKDFTKITKFNIDHWGISNDHKLLHWGAFVENKDEWDDIKIQAEAYAKKTTNLDFDRLNKVSQRIKDNWYTRYSYYINKHLSDIPQGWFLSSYNVDKVLKESIKI